MITDGLTKTNMLATRGRKDYKENLFELLVIFRGQNQ
jgi:hypothetical protein